MHKDSIVKFHHMIITRLEDLAPFWKLLFGRKSDFIFHSAFLSHSFYLWWSRERRSTSGALGSIVKQIIGCSFDELPGRPRCSLVSATSIRLCGFSLEGKLIHKRITTALRRGLTVDPGKPEIASTVDHASEAGQAAVTKHRKSRRKKPKNAAAAAAAAGDSKVRFFTFIRLFLLFAFLAICNFTRNSLCYNFLLTIWLSENLRFLDC